MDKYTTFSGLAAILDMANVDTDQIMPKQFLKRVEKAGYGEALFYHWRFRDDGSVNPDFALNQARYQGAEVLVTRENFGSGSSREHAPWALADYGFRALIAPSFADIFKNNCLGSGLLTVELPAEVVSQWFERIKENQGYEITVDLANQKITGSDGFVSGFDIEPFRKERLMLGLDAIGLTLQQEEAIAAYEAAHDKPWQAAIAG